MVVGSEASRTMNLVRLGRGPVEVAYRVLCCHVTDSRRGL